LNEESVRGRGLVLKCKQAAAYVHVDDAIFLAAGETAEAFADGLMEEAADGLERMGFVVPDRQRASELDDVVGYRPRRSPARIEIPL